MSWFFFFFKLSDSWHQHLSLGWNSVFEKNKLVHFLVQRGRTICRKERDGAWVSSTKEIQRKLYDLAFFRFFFFFFCSKCICCVVWLDILLLCGDISSLDQYKQRKHGVWEGTRRVMNTEIQGEAAEIWGQAFGLPQSVVNYQGWVSCAQKFGERKHPAGLCHARNLSLGSKFIIGIAFAFLIAMCLTLNFWSLRRPHQRHPSPTDILPATLDKWARPGPPMKFPLFFFFQKTLVMVDKQLFIWPLVFPSWALILDFMICYFEEGTEFITYFC